MERASKAASVIVLTTLAILGAMDSPQAGQVDPIQGRIDLIKDVQQTDAVRTKAAQELASARYRRTGGVEALVALGKASDVSKGGTEENICMHVAIALTSVRGDAGTQMAVANLPLSTKWLTDGKDKALRYWAANLVAMAQSKEAGKTLATVLGTLDPKTDRGLRSAVVTAMSTLGGDLGAKAEEFLLGLMDSKVSEERIEGIEGLRKSKTPRPNVDVIDRLVKEVKTNDDEAVWRAAALALREVVPGSLRGGLNFSAGISKEERLSILKQWERRWIREKKRILAALPKPEGEE